MKLSLASLAIGLLGLSLNAYADFYKVASPAFGADSLTFDSSQKLYWLTPSATVGKSYNQVSELLVSDAKFSGFRFASVAELGNLYSAFGIPDVNDYGAVINGTAANVPGATSLQSFLGITYNAHVAGIYLLATGGFVGAPFVSSINGFPSVYLGEVVIRINVPTTAVPMSFAYVATELSSATVGSRYEGVGSWLVSDVPEPASWELLASGILVCLSIVARKKASPPINADVQEAGVALLLGCRLCAFC